MGIGSGNIVGSIGKKDILKEDYKVMM